MSVNPRSPVKANHRFMQKMMSVVLSGKVEHVPAEFDLISQVFKKAGGSWEKLFHGSPQEFSLLRKVMKVALDKGYLTKKQQWGV